MKYKIKKDQIGMRLDLFLAAKLKTKSRSEIQKLIESGFVLVSGEKKSKHWALKDSDIVETIRKVAEAKKQKVDFDIEVVYENDDFLVVNKPSGLIVHGAAHIKEKTLVDWLLSKYPRLKGVGENPFRPGIMHRLDKEASGLMVVAKNNETFFHLKRQFQLRLVEKGYMALVYGDVSKDNDFIDFPIKRSAAGYRQASFPEKYEEGIADAGELRSAYTEFNVARRFQNYTLLRVKIKSGRKHQIRVHFYAYGHPLVGDNLYSTRRTKSLNKDLKLGRIFLVSVSLAFSDLSEKRHEFNLPIPLELENFLETIK